MKSSRLNADVILEIAAYLNDLDRLSLAYSCSTAFRLSQSSRYWRGTIPPARFKRIARWSDYSGEEYRVAAFQTTHLRRELEFVSANRETHVLYSKRHERIRIKDEQDEFYHISGTRWLLDLKSIEQGQYTFLDVRTKRKCSTNLDLPVSRRSCFYAASPTEILLMHPGPNRKFASDGLDRVQLFRFIFTEDQDKIVRVACTTLWSLEPGYDGPFGCDDRYAVVCSYEINEASKGFQGIVRVHEINTGTTHNWTTKFSFSHLLVSRGYVLLLNNGIGGKHPRIVIEKLSRLTMAPKAIRENPLTSEFAVFGVKACHAISTKRNTFIIKPEKAGEGYRLDSWDIYQAQSRDGDIEGRFCVIFTEGTVSRIYSVEAKENIRDRDISDFNDNDTFEFGPDDSKVQYDEILQDQVVDLSEFLSTVNNQPPNAISHVLSFKKMNQGVLAYCEGLFNTETFQILDPSWNPIFRIRRMMTSLNYNRDEGDTTLFGVSKTTTVKPIVIDMRGGLIIFSVMELADEGGVKAKYLDVFWI